MPHLPNDRHLSRPEFSEMSYSATQGAAIDFQPRQPGFALVLVWNLADGAEDSAVG
jgi:hypothetical protein